MSLMKSSYTVEIFDTRTNKKIATMKYPITFSEKELNEKIDMFFSHFCIPQFEREKHYKVEVTKPRIFLAGDFINN